LLSALNANITLLNNAVVKEWEEALTIQFASINEQSSVPTRLHCAIQTAVTVLRKSTEHCSK
jgi:hypothetical protein